METFCTARLDPARRSVESRDFETELRCKIVGHPIDVLEGSGRSAIPWGATMGAGERLPIPIRGKPMSS